MSVIFCFFSEFPFSFCGPCSLVDSSLTTILSAVKNICLDDQRSALVQLRQDFLNQSASASNSAIGSRDRKTDCCSWECVEYGAVGHVVNLDLSYSGHLDKVIRIV